MSLLAFTRYDLLTAAPVWAWLQPAILFAAWFSRRAASRGDWTVVGLCLLVTVAAPWGYVYPGPLFAIVGAVLSFRKGVVESRNGEGPVKLNGEISTDVSRRLPPGATTAAQP